MNRWITALRHRRSRAIARRWFTILSFGVLAGTVVAPLTGLAWRGTRGILQALEPVPEGLVAFGAAGLLVAVLWTFGRRRWSGLVGFRYFWSYPPLWLAAWIGTLAWAALIDWFGYPSAPVALTARRLMEIGVPASALLGALAILLATSARVRGQSSNAVPASQESQLASGDFDWLLEWVRSDDAIGSSSEDQFGHRLVADRICRRLSETGEPSTLALVGPKGSGKTTIGNFVKERLSSERRFVFVRLSLWPFETPAAAVRGILDAVVAGLATRVDVTSLTEVRQQYIDAIKAAGGRFEWAASILADRRTPEQLLQIINDVALAAGFRVLLWIEDLERFAGSEQLAGDVLALREVERLSSIRALLYLLDQSSQIAVVVATTSLESRFDVDKIARFIERPPKPPMAQVARLIIVARKRCLVDWPRPVTDAAQKVGRARLDALDTELELKGWLFAIGDETANPELALCALAATPRSLKNMLRGILDSWKALAGELDFDDVCFATALRETAPNVFTVIDDTIDAIRGRYRNFISDDAPEDSSQFKRLKEAIDGTGLKAPLVTCIVQHLFPGLPLNKTVTLSDEGRPQGFQVDGYWERWTAGAPMAAGDSDQAALRELDQWVCGEATSFVSRLRSPAFATVIQRFSHRIPGAEVGRLLEDAASLDSRESAASWGDGHNAPGVVAVWRLAQKKIDLDQTRLARALENAVAAHISTHLPVANTLVYFFTVRESSTRDVLNETDRAAVRNTAEAGLANGFRDSDGPKRLSEAIRGGNLWSVYHLAWGLDRIRSGQTVGSPFSDWPCLAEPLLKLAADDPATGVPLILPFVTGADRAIVHGGNGPSSIWDAKFNRDQAEALFDLDRLREVILIDVLTDDAELRARWLAAAQGLRGAAG